ncbi:hypothetical protein [Streptomyces sp. NPDC014744]|uniref:hypothetical protein n=1 Tax=Streptomyces sp. NPDC014744 TaxID=3364903 RepID=UPI0036FE6CF1
MEDQVQEGMQLRDVTALTVPRAGRVEETGDPSLPYRLLDQDGIEVAAVTEFLLDMLADDDSPASLRSYAYELLAWFWFLWAVDVPSDRDGRAEARDFALWLKMVKRPLRPRRPDAQARAACTADRTDGTPWHRQRPWIRTGRRRRAPTSSPLPAIRARSSAHQGHDD